MSREYGFQLAGVLIGVGILLVIMKIYRLHRAPGEANDKMIYMVDQPEDKALETARKRFQYYHNRQNRAQLRSQALDILLLLVTAATTLAAAVQVNRWVTASLAAGSVVVAGLRKIFNWDDTFVRSAVAASEVQAAIDDYELLPQENRTLAAQKTLLDKIHAIIRGETGAFAETYQRRSLS